MPAFFLNFFMSFCPQVVWLLSRQAPPGRDHVLGERAALAAAALAGQVPLRAGDVRARGLGLLRLLQKQPLLRTALATTLSFSVQRIY